MGEKGKSAREKEIWRGAPSLMLELPVFILLAALFVILISVTVNLPKNSPASGWLWTLSMLPLFVALIRYLAIKSQVYRLTSTRIYWTRGILAKQDTEIRLRDVRSVQVRRTISDTLFGLGKIEIGTAGTGGIEMVMSGLRGVNKVVEIIRSAQDDAGESN